jgi:hypothetical protein
MKSERRRCGPGEQTRAPRESLRRTAERALNFDGPHGQPTLFSLLRDRVFPRERYDGTTEREKMRKMSGGMRSNRQCKRHGSFKQETDRREETIFTGSNDPRAVHARPAGYLEAKRVLVRGINDS